jgi:ABC-2 type transport system ATP-binding protein
MQDIEALCTRVVVIDHGRIMHDGALAELKERYGGRKRLVLTLSRAVDVADLPALPWPDIDWQQDSPVELRALFPASTVAAGAILERVLPHVPVADVAIEEPSIEQVVKELYGERAG